jgi:DNA-binding protein WhiA
VKDELCHFASDTVHCAAAEMAAIIDSCGCVSQDAINMQTENAALAKKFYQMLKNIFHTQGEISIRLNRQFKRTRLYTVSARKTDSLAESLGFAHTQSLLLNRECCRKAYVRGSFLACGSLSDPEKNYHLEFVLGQESHSHQLAGIINGFGLRAKITARKGHCIVYLKEGENIVDLLNIMGAHLSLLNLENVRIVKDMRNNVNRKVNCETANLSKTVTAAVRQIQDIEMIESLKGLAYLGEPLADVARLRVKYEEASLKEIGDMLSPPVGKSGVNHRLRKISKIADQLRGDRNDETKYPSSGQS